MSDAAYIALVETASSEGVQARLRHLRERGPHEMGWNYANIAEVEGRLKRQLERKGYFRIYLHLNGEGGTVRYAMRVTSLTTYPEPKLHQDPVDGRFYLVHSRMLVQSIDELPQPKTLESFTSVDRRKPDLRHLQIGFLFVVDPEV